MGIIYFEGFEGGDVPDWALSGSSVISSSGLDMDGDYCLYLPWGQKSASLVIDEISELYISLKTQMISQIADMGIIGVKSDSQKMIELIWDRTNHNIYIRRAGSTIAIGTASFVAEQTYLLEIYIKIDDTVGRVQTWVNGILDIDFTGDTKPDIQTTINRVTFGNLVYTYSGNYVDNLILSTESIGERFIQAIVPTGTGNSDEFAPSAGDNWGCVDEIPASEDDWSETNTPDAICTFQASDLTGNIATVDAIKVQALAKIEGDTAVPKLQLVIRSNGADYTSDSKDVPNTTPINVFEIWTEDPAGGALTEEIVNGFEVGFKAKAS